ncbi:hypothetical protein [Flaviaesturariibacter amylovorans]|uniref:Uncharacterized protein n=1 Tax=Flaviaesturariibacter amylovorans TaxID=1084520 RepID=A0ABP8HT92_9BACT
MRKYAILLLLACGFAGSAARSDGKVFVCDSRTSIAYHNTSSCRGLNRCTHRVIQISAGDAIRVYRNRKCRICY